MSLTLQQSKKVFGINVTPIDGTYAQLTVSGIVVTFEDLSYEFKSHCSFVDIQVEGGSIRYVNDSDATPTATVGFAMVPVVNDSKRVAVEDLKKWKMIKSDLDDAVINIQQYA